MGNAAPQRLLIVQVHVSASTHRPIHSMLQQRHLSPQHTPSMKHPLSIHPIHPKRREILPQPVQCVGLCCPQHFSCWSSF